MPVNTPAARRVAAVSGVVGASLGAASALGSLSAAAYFARVLLTPERARPDNVAIVEAAGDRLVLDVTEDSVQPGRYGLWFDAGRGHLRLGDIVDIDARAGRVVRTIEDVDLGRPVPGPARWNGSYYALGPAESLGLDTRHVHVASDVGDLPAWLIPGAGTPQDVGAMRGTRARNAGAADVVDATDAVDGTRARHPAMASDARARPGPESSGERWAVLVHGRGATRHECLRAVPTLHRLGFTCLVPTYRNDPQGPPSPDGRYNLGLSEWRDVDAALRYARDHGAREVVLVGWSMGGAIVLQTLDLSSHADIVTRVVLDGPVIDWGDVIAHHARLRRLPPGLVTLSRTLIGAPWGRRLVGVHESLDVARTDWQHRSDELRHPMLVVHSNADEFVPVGPSAELARRRPDLVTLERWEVARHVREWNVDPARWERVVGDFVARP